MVISPGFEFASTDQSLAGPDKSRLAGEVGRHLDQDGTSLTPDAREAVLFEPIIETRSDLLAYLGANSTGGEVASDLHLLQPVPGFPDDDRYSGPQFGSVRRAFSEACVAAAAGEERTLISLWDELGAGRGLSDALSISARTASSDYDRECMTPLDQVPEGIRSVTGILAARIQGVSAPFCSATAIGPDRIATSRHCFFRSDTGAARPSLSRLKDGRVEFWTFAPNAGTRVFSASLAPAAVEREQAFAPYDDLLLLSARGSAFEQWAAPDPNARLVVPTTTWVVGRNNLIGEITRASSLFDLARGSAPDACAVIEQTETGCLYHTCQTGPATSGAGIVRVEPSGSVRLLGVHKGTIKGGANCEAAAPTHLSINLGAAASRLSSRS